MHRTERIVLWAYQGSYDDASLDAWAARIRAWHSGGEPADAARIAADRRAAHRKRDVFCFFDNDVKVRAPFDARRLIDRLGLGAGLAPIAAAD